MNEADAASSRQADEMGFAAMLGHGTAHAAASLDDLVARLARRGEVAGLVPGGSHAAGRQTAWSDLDLLLVFRGPMVPFTHVTTTAGGTLTEIVCCTAGDLQAAMTGEAPAHWDAATFVRFLRGRVLFDRAGLLDVAVAWASSQPEPGPDLDPYGRWRHAQYNVRQTQRYLESGDAAARAAVVARMLYQLHDILIDYFMMRNMAWPGDKEALTFWQTNEPALREAWLAAVAVPDIDRKVEAWIAMFPSVYARFGGLATPEVELIQPGADMTIEQAYAAWRNVIA